MGEEQNTESQEAESKDELESALEDSKGEGDTKEGKEEEDTKETQSKDEGDIKEAEEKKEGEGDEGSKDPDPVEQLQEEVKDLRQMVRTSKRELTITQAKLERLGERPERAETRDEDEDDDDEGKGKKESLSTVEELQGAIAQIGATKGASLDILLETMKQNSKYEDIQEVCSRGNFDDIFEVIATEATKSGGNFDETLLEVELSIWNKTNPYKYMYDLIKKYHPNYSKKEGTATPDSKREGSKTPEKVKAPGTIADKGGDSNLKSGWTAKRIDDLPEEELHTVPREIYDKYMRDELD